jgi:glycosyltransferase involved in cell wall biosynthesis
MDYKFKIAFLSSYPPRECGIANYTSDLSSAISKINLNKPQVIALNNNSSKYEYGPEVVFQIQDETLNDYLKAADFVNKSDIQLVHIQHEFGLLGPKSKGTGEYIIQFAKKLKKPFVITYHTILSGPSAERVKAVHRLSNLANSNIAMVNLGKKYLKEIYDTDPTKIKIIHHGVPDIGELKPSDNFKSKIDLKDKIVLSTFGLVNPGKGIEYVIRALPEIIKKYPNVIYLVLGQTHPHIKKKVGEVYREQLKEEVKKLKLEKYVHFENRYLSLKEIINYLRATDIYITPYLNPQQITSGTLAYAIGAGKVCLSTRYLYAKELLSHGKGIFIDYRNPEDISKKVNKLLANPLDMQKISRKAYLFGRQMIWPNVARNHLKLYYKIIHKNPWTKKINTVKKKIISPALKASQILNISKD